MKPMPDADENRRLAGIQNDKAGKLPDGPAKDSHLKKARDHESSPVRTPTTGATRTFTRRNNGWAS
jgi:hypothetical protein